MNYLSSWRSKIKGERIIGLCIVLLMAYVTFRHFYYVRSTQAFVNAQITNVYAPIYGELQQGELEQGTYLPRDTPLFSIANPRYGGLAIVTEVHNLQNSIDTIDMEIKNNEISVDQLERRLEKSRELYKTGSVPEEEIEDGTYQLQTFRSTTESKQKQKIHLEQSLGELREQLARHRATAVQMPYEGVIWAAYHKNGEIVNQGDLVLQVLNPGKMWIDGFFSKRDAKRLHHGTRVTVTLPDYGRRFKGVVSFVRGSDSSQGDSESLPRPAAKDGDRFVAVRIRVDWKDMPPASEFYGYKRTAVITTRR